MYLGILDLGFTSLSIQLSSISKQGLSWTRCLSKSSQTLSKVEAVMKLNYESKDVFSVMISNVAVFETNFQSNMQ